MKALTLSNLFVAASCLSACGSYAPINYTPDSKLLTTSNILAVRPGMSMAQVKAILGEPLKETANRDAEYYCDCNSRRLCGDSSFTFQYSTTRVLMPYPMLWVRFNIRKKVEQVYVQRHDGEDNPYIYMVRSNPCDKSDRLVPPPDTITLNMAGLRSYF